MTPPVVVSSNEARDRRAAGRALVPRDGGRKPSGAGPRVYHAAVSPPPEIPLLRVAGSHREAGRQVGHACAATIRKAEAFDEDIPCGRTREEQLALAERYRAVTATAYPWYLEELEGIAEGAGADPLALFAAMT